MIITIIWSQQYEKLIGISILFLLLFEFIRHIIFKFIEIDESVMKISDEIEIRIRIRKMVIW